MPQQQVGRRGALCFAADRAGQVPSPKIGDAASQSEKARGFVLTKSSFDSSPSAYICAILNNLAVDCRASAISHDVISHGRAFGKCDLSGGVHSRTAVDDLCSYSDCQLRSSRLDYICTHRDSRRGRYLEPWACCSLCFGWSVASTAFVTWQDHFPRKGTKHENRLNDVFGEGH